MATDDATHSTVLSCEPCVECRRADDISWRIASDYAVRCSAGTHFRVKKALRTNMRGGYSWAQNLRVVLRMRLPQRMAKSEVARVQKQMKWRQVR
jgi:hypothetical protein